jgi:molecular chaperone DnaJ
MATAERDYYELLGVPRDADDADIKKAFRKLARELHPDVNEDPDAEHRFKEVAEAYEVLSDPERRRTYDQYGHAGLRSGGYAPSDFDFSSLSDIFGAFFGDGLFGGGQRSSRVARGPDLTLSGEISLAEALTGTTLRLSARVARTCDGCSGSGAAAGTSPVVCGTCGGRGQVQHISQNVFGQFVRAGACGTCSGSGRLIQSPCGECEGEGRVVIDRTLEVEVPPGIDDGQRIRLQGEGHSGTQGAPPGDAYVQVGVRSEQGLERDGDDLHTLAEVTITQAALGVVVSVPSAEGPFDVELQPGAQPGDVVAERGKGMPSLRTGRRGDLHVHVRVRVPRRLTPEQRDRVLELERELGDEAYRDDEGLFGRLRNVFR